MKVDTYADAAAEITRAGLSRGDVARVMGYTEAQFSGAMKDREGKPSRQFKAALRDAIVAAAAGVPTS